MHVPQATQAGLSIPATFFDSIKNTSLDDKRSLTESDRKNCDKVTEICSANNLFPFRASCEVQQVFRLYC